MKSFQSQQKTIDKRNNETYDR